MHASLEKNCSIFSYDSYDPMFYEGNDNQSPWEQKRKNRLFSGLADHYIPTHQVFPLWNIRLSLRVLPSSWLLFKNQT